MTLGQRIQELRKQQGLSQEALGEALGVSRQAVSKWELDNGIPELDTLIAMSRLFGITVGQLLGVEEASENDSADNKNEIAHDTDDDRIESVLHRYTEQKAKDDYIEKKIRQLDARKERQKQRKAKRADEAENRQQMELLAEQERIAAFKSAPLKVGEKVKVKENGMVGEVTKVSAKAVVVAIGNISSKMPLDRVERITSNEYRTAVKEVARSTTAIRTDTSITERKLNFSTEIDLRGERLNDAIEKVMRYVDDAIMLNVSSVRIIHGKGTGVLRDEIQKFLRSTPGVAGVRDEHIQFGGTGVTIVTFD